MEDVTALDEAVENLDKVIWKADSCRRHSAMGIGSILYDASSPPEKPKAESRLEAEERKFKT